MHTDDVFVPRERERYTAMCALSLTNGAFSSKIDKYAERRRMNHLKEVHNARHTC